MDSEDTSSEKLESHIENILKADQETIDSLEDGPYKNQAERIRKIAEEIKEGERTPEVS